MNTDKIYPRAACYNYRVDRGRLYRHYRACYSCDAAVCRGLSRSIAAQCGELNSRIRMLSDGIILKRDVVAVPTASLFVRIGYYCSIRLFFLPYDIVLCRLYAFAGHFFFLGSIITC